MSTGFTGTSSTTVSITVTAAAVQQLKKSKNALETDEWPNNQLGLSTNLSSEEDEDSQEIPLQNPIGKRARIGGLLAPLWPTSRHKKSEAY